MVADYEVLCSRCQHLHSLVDDDDGEEEEEEYNSTATAVFYFRDSDEIEATLQEARHCVRAFCVRT